MADEGLSVETVREYLRPHGVEVLELPDDTSTAISAAAALHTDVATIVKSLVFLVDGEPLLALVAGDRKVDRERLARELHAAKVRLAPPDVVLRVSGYAVGGVPPLAHRQPMRTLIDLNLLQYPTVYAAAGASNALFPISPERLMELTGAEVVGV